MVNARRGTFHGPVRLLLCAALAVGGGTLIARGWGTARVRHEVSRVATTFLEAVRDGDALAAHALLDDDRREIHARRAASFDWTPLPGAHIDVRSIAIEDDSAVVESRIEFQGYTLKPRLALRRTSKDEWRITAVSDLYVDPLWIDRRDEAVGEQNRSMTDSLRRAFEKPASPAESP